ncbi:MAG: hypothetical protein GX938_02200 [Spirochaetales bacterium]|jgi:hypothetical protein|nr:hypothetical protein [Spirochaetales bacterium]
MNSAPIMIVGLMLGLYFTFFGYTARKLLILISSLFSGGLVSLAISVAIQDFPGVLALLSDGYTGAELFALFLGPAGSMALLINVVSFGAGSLILFFLARSSGALTRPLLGIFAPISAALLVLGTLRLFLPLSASLVFAAGAWVLILIVSLFSFDLFLAVESAIIAAMALSLLVTRFWYLSSWVFYTLWALLALLGIFNQRSMIRSKEAGDE